jgi:acetoin utilization deacetylase AcuC-like enzyme
MEIIKNKNPLNHNLYETLGEGGYRTELIEGTDILLDEENRQQAKIYVDIVHSNDHINDIQVCSEMECELAEVFLTKQSFDCAIESVALTIIAAQPLIEGLGGKFAVTRPPGHHASRNKSEGFCLFNNVACAAEYLVSNGMRIAILDLDIHHGNGTQNIFYERSDVFFASIHKEGIYPPSGMKTEMGEGVGYGYTANFPLAGNVKKELFLETIGNAMEKIKQFSPDAIALSMGFDTFRGDRMMVNMGWEIEIEDYEKIGQLISSYNIAMFAVLEGGYHSFINDTVKRFVKGIS